MREFDVVIIGAGPAGSVCGYLLKKAGVSCLLIDHATFPRDKLCGGGLTPKCWKLLEELIPGIKYEYNCIRDIRLTVEDCHCCDFTTETELRLVKRKVFDNQLLELYKSLGGEFLHGAFLRYDEQSDGLVVTLKSGEQIACRYLVGADGSTSTVRHFLTGNHDNGFLILEQYEKKAPENRIEVELSRKYNLRGYYYRFPNSEFDAIGYGADVATAQTYQTFYDILKEKNIPVTKLRGCHIYLKNDYPLNDRVILIGDAGGFANRVTSEGIKAAFETARNAAQAITNGRPFREVNAHMFAKMQKEERFAHFFFKPSIIKILGWLCHSPSVVKWGFDRALRP